MEVATITDVLLWILNFGRLTKVLFEVKLFRCLSVRSIIRNFGDNWVNIIFWRNALCGARGSVPYLHAAGEDTEYKA